MSNTMVGSVYSKIMDEVIENCVVTFEEDGVERRLLDEVKKTWQAKLSERKVALMPWDPPPAASAVAGTSQTNSGPSSSQAARAHAVAEAAKAAAANSANGAAAIKTEPQGGAGSGGYDLQNLPPANGMTAPSYTNNTGVALERASQHLQDRFGASADRQITQLQAQRANADAGAGQGRGPPVAPQPSPQQAAAIAEQRQKMLAQQAAQMHKAQAATHSGVGGAQTDGVADAGAEWDAFVAERRAGGSASGVQADSSLRELVELRAREMEAGGVFEPVSRAGKGKGRALAAAAATEPSHVGGRFDGPDSDEMGRDDEDDEDAINSELDDDDDEPAEETEDDGNAGEIMLCTYDKVQRVKNKWKCTLKDGVLTTGSREYVFHKAQGEFEW